MNERLNKQLDSLSGFVLIAFPVALLIDDLLPKQASPMQFIVSLSAAWLFGASIIALARKTWIYRPRTVIVAGAFALFGIFGSVGIMVFRFVTETIRQTEGAIGNAAQFDAAIGKTTPFIFMPGLIPPLILFFLAAMLLRFQNKSRWAFALACVGILLFPAGRIFLGQTVILLSDALLLISLGFLGWQILSGRYNAEENKLRHNSTKPLTAILSLLWMIFALSGQAAAVCPLGGNLILNGDAEANPAAPANGENVDVADWGNETAGFTIFRYGLSGIPATNSPGGPANRGTFLFAGGNNSGNSSGSQTIDVAECAVQIDGGSQSFSLSGYFGGFENQNDNSRLTITFLDAGGISLGTATVGAVLAADRNNITEVLFRGTAGLMPVGTRTVTAVLLHTRTTGNNNNGYADNLSFILTSPTAVSISISGRVLTGQKNPIGKARITLTDSTGNERVVISNPFGFYRFDEVPAGDTYILSVSSKRYTFADSPRVISVFEEIGDADFVAVEFGN